MYKTRNTGTGDGMRGTQGMRGMSPNIPGNVVKHFGECSQTIQGIFEKNLGHFVKHTVEV